MPPYLHAMNSEINRCSWCGSDPLYVNYHDVEWGAPVYDSQKMFETLMLECFQSGLSWITILRRRDAFRAAFHNFDAERIAAYNESDLNRLLADERIIRNRAKINAAVNNARVYCALLESGDDLSKWLWRFVNEPIQNTWTHTTEVPAKTGLSETISKELKQLGFAFLGPTVVYAHMQATGMVNDHLITCFRHNELR